MAEPLSVEWRRIGQTNDGRPVFVSTKTGKRITPRVADDDAPAVLRKPEFAQPQTPAGKFQPEHPIREDIGTTVKWGVPTALAPFTGGMSLIPAVGALTGAGIASSAAGQEIAKGKIDPQEALKFGIGMGASEAGGRAIPKVLGGGRKLIDKALGIGTREFGGGEAEAAASEALDKWAQEHGIAVPRDVINRSGRGQALRYYADESLLSRNIGKKFFEQQAKQVEEAWNKEIAALGKPESARRLGLKASRAVSTGLGNLNDRIAQIYGMGDKLSPKAKVDVSDYLTGVIGEIRDTLKENTRFPGMAGLNEKKLAVLSQLFPSMNREMLIETIGKRDLTDAQIARNNGRVPLKTARRLVSTLSAIGRDSTDPLEKGEAAQAAKSLWDYVYGDSAKLADADPRAISFFRRGNKMYRQLKTYERNIPGFKEWGEGWDPERFASNIKSQHVTDLNVLTKLVDKYAGGVGKFGPGRSEALNGIRLAVLREALKNPEDFGRTVFSGFGKKTERRFGQSVMHDLFGKDPVGRRILHNIDMITDLYVREPRFNPSGTGAALLTARGVRDAQKMLGEAVRAIRIGTRYGAPGAAAGVGYAAGGPVGAALSAGGELVVPVLLAKTLYSPRATRALISGMETGSLQRGLPYLLRAIGFAQTDFPKMVEHASSGYADTRGARYAAH